MNTQQVWETYNQDVKKFILSKVKNEEEANDILQDIFIKIHTKLDTVKDFSKVKSWIMIVTRNTMMDYFNNNISHIEINEEITEDEERVNSHTEKDCLLGIVKNLPKKYRDPLFLSDIKGIKQAEVASQLKLSLSAAKSRIQRARKLIAKGYMNCCDFQLNEKGHLVGEVKDREDCKACN